MAEDLDLPWPHCLGSFDEESCRYFLHEIGTRIVPNYPFSFGIEEVYGLILERYGYERSPDVTSLLQELLEDFHNADGLGDDGDIWRSWRHGWRHRNDDLLNPFIPRFGHVTLQRSTPSRIRYLKANNFIQACENEYSQLQVFQYRHPTCTGGSREAKNANNHTSRVRSSPMMLESIGLGTKGENLPSRASNQFHSQQRLRSHTESDNDGGIHQACKTPAVGDNNTVRALTGERPSACQFDLTQFRDGAATENCGDESASNLETAEKILEDSGLEKQVSRILWKQPQHNSCPQECQINSSSQSAGLASPMSDEIHGKFELKRNDEEKLSGSLTQDSVQLEVKEPADQRASMPILDARQAIITPERKRRAVNREAQLINGTIFTSRTHRSRTVNQVKASVPLCSNTCNKRSSARLSWSPVKQRDSLRSNWAREIFHVLRRDKRENKPMDDQAGESVTNICETDDSCQLPKVSMACNQHSQKTTYQTSQHTSVVGLDGAADARPVNTSPLNLNKPLPLSPDEIVQSMSSRSCLTTSQHTENTSSLPSASSATSSLSGNSSKRDFRGLTHELLNQDMLGPHELAPIQELDVDIKDSFDPPKSPAPPTSPISYTSVANSNPFINDERFFRSSIRPPPLNLSTLNANKYSGAPQPPILTNQMQAKETQAESYFPPLAFSEPSHVEQQHEDVLFSRGRSEPRPASPTQPQKENIPPKTPTKRSRSPIKRFLGLTKSNSTNQLESRDAPPRPITPATTKKDSFKKWSDRIRYGFLTPDQEQLRQEELIEAHNGSSSSTPQISTFPISLDPPLQAKVQSEIELIVTVTANRYLMREAHAGRISAESVARTKELWEKLNRPQVVEFHYDQLTQHNLVMANLDRVRIYGDAVNDPIAINSTLRGWKTMAREMSVRTFCSPDSVLRKHLHDAHRVLELLGAPLVTFMAYEDMQLRTLQTISQRQRERIARRAGSAGRNVSNSSDSTHMTHRRNASEGSYQKYDYDYSDYPITALQMDKIRLPPSPTPITGNKVRKATGAEGAVMSLPTNFERSRDNYASRIRDAKIGKSVREI